VGPVVAMVWEAMVYRQCPQLNRATKPAGGRAPARSAAILAVNIGRNVDPRLPMPLKPLILSRLWSSPELERLDARRSGLARGALSALRLNSEAVEAAVANKAALAARQNAASAWLA